MTLSPQTECNRSVVQVEQLRQARLQAEAYKEQVADAQGQQSAQARALHQLQQQHEHVVDQMCALRQRAAAHPQQDLHAHEGAALEQVEEI